MRKIKVFAHISLDGVISPGDEDNDYSNGGWTASYRTPEGAAAVAESQGANFDLLLGRRTYDLWAGFWPKAPSSPFADRLNAATKYVATDRPEGLEWGPVVNLGEGVAVAIRDLKASDGPALVVWGSTSVTSVLFKEGLVDEVVLMVIPVLMGRGKRFFSGDSRGLALISSQATPSGVLVNHYQYVGPALPA